MSAYNLAVMFYFLSVFSIELGDRNEKKRVSRMQENAYLSIKNCSAYRALKQTPDPIHINMLTSLM